MCEKLIDRQVERQRSMNQNSMNKHIYFFKKHPTLHLNIQLQKEKKKKKRKEREEREEVRKTHTCKCVCPVSLNHDLVVSITY